MRVTKSPYDSRGNQYTVFVNILILYIFVYSFLYYSITDDFTVSK